MTVTVWIGLTSQKAKSTIDSDGRIVRNYSHDYLYQTDALSRPTAADIAAHLGIVPGSPYGDDANAIAGAIEISSRMTRIPHLAYDLHVDWSTATTLPLAVDTDPTTMRTLWTIEPTIQSTYIFEDRAKNLILNTAGQPFDGGVPADVRYGTVTATRNINASGYDKTAVLANSGKWNSASYLGAAIETLQVDIKSTETYEGGYHFWKEVYTFTYRPKGIQPRPANVGFYQRTGIGSNDLLHITERDFDGTSPTDNKVQEPEPLDDHGILVPISARPGSCKFIVVDFYDSMDFATFAL